MKTDSRLSAYYHGNMDFANVWERCWSTRTIPITKGRYMDGACWPASLPYIRKIHVRRRGLACTQSINGNQYTIKHQRWDRDHASTTPKTKMQGLGCGRLCPRRWQGSGAQTFGGVRLLGEGWRNSRTRTRTRLLVRAGTAAA